MANINLKFIVLCATKFSELHMSLIFFLYFFYTVYLYFHYVIFRNNWRKFEPYTNVLWLHYILDKMITAVRYKKKNLKIHKHAITKLKEFKDTILNYDSAYDFVINSNSVLYLWCKLIWKKYLDNKSNFAKFFKYFIIFNKYNYTYNYYIITTLK